jgi:hypothetical protein
MVIWRMIVMRLDVCSKTCACRKAPQRHSISGLHCFIMTAGVCLQASTPDGEDAPADGKMSALQQQLEQQRQEVGEHCEACS